MKRISALAALFVLSAGLAGCQNMVPISHSDLKAGTPVNETIQVDQLAVNARKERPNLIGSHSFTVFAIPMGDINVEKPLPEIMHPYVESALRKAGYSTVDIRGKKAADAPVLRGEIKNFWFAGYSWFWPAFVQGGNIQYHLVLQKPNGTVLWEKLFKSDGIGSSFVADIGYENMITPAMTNLLNQVIAAVQSKEFIAALQAK